MTKYLRIKSGEANFQLVERFDEVKKAADPNAQGEVVECKVENIKLDFTKVTKEKGWIELKTRLQKLQGSSSRERNSEMYVHWTVQETSK